MQVNWREIPAARNSFAVLGAACEKTGWHLYPVAWRDRILHATPSIRSMNICTAMRSRMRTA